MHRLNDTYSHQSFKTRMINGKILYTYGGEDWMPSRKWNGSYLCNTKKSWKGASVQYLWFGGIHRQPCGHKTVNPFLQSTANSFNPVKDAWDVRFFDALIPTLNFTLISPTFSPMFSSWKKSTCGYKRPIQTAKTFIYPSILDWVGCDW